MHFQVAFETCAFLDGHRSDRCRTPIWPVRGLAHVGHRSDRCGEPVWPVRVARLCFMVSLHAHVQREYAFVQGELLWLVVLCFGGFALILLMVSNPFASTRGVGRLWACALPSDLVLPFLVLVTSLSLFFFFFGVFLFIFVGWLCVLLMHSSRGRLRTSVSEDQWMIAP